MSETTNLEEVQPLREKNTTEINEVESTPLAKRNKEEQLRAELGLKRKGIELELYKMRELEQRAQHFG